MFRKKKPTIQIQKRHIPAGAMGYSPQDIARRTGWSVEDCQPHPEISGIRWSYMVGPDEIAIADVVPLHTGVFTSMVKDLEDKYPKLYEEVIREVHFL